MGPRRLASFPSSPDLGAGGPDPDLRYRHRVSVVRSIQELWRFRPLVRALTERELRARYKHAYLGFGWALIGPLLQLLAFQFVFQQVVEVDSGGVPYSLFSAVGLLGWGLFSGAASGSIFSLLGNVSLLNKLYCPREIFPMSTVALAAFDTSVSSVVLLGLFVFEGEAPAATSVLVPIVLVVHLAWTLGVVFIVSSVTVYLRDLRHGFVLLLQVGLFLTPVAWGIEQIDARWRFWYCLANPMGAVIDSYRRTVLIGTAPNWEWLGGSALTSFAVLYAGYRLFKRLEVGLADVV